MTDRQTREERDYGLIRAGELEVTGENQSEVDAYFAPDFAFHGPDGAELDYDGLQVYFSSVRAAFDDLTLSRGNHGCRGRLRRVPDGDHRNLRA